MQNEKHAEVAILMYLGGLIFITLINMFKEVSFLDVVYLIVVLSCVLRYLVIKKKM